MTEKVKWRDVESSNIERVGWGTFGHSEVVLVEFKDGRAYAYIGVTRQRAVAMIRAASVGRYFARWIKGHYDYLRIR